MRKQKIIDTKTPFIDWLSTNLHRINTDAPYLVGRTDGQRLYIRASEIRGTDYREPESKTLHKSYYTGNEYRSLNGQLVWCAVFVGVFTDPAFAEFTLRKAWTAPTAWTPESLQREAWRYASRVTFAKHSPDAYEEARKTGQLKGLEFRRKNRKISDLKEK